MSTNIHIEFRDTPLGSMAYVVDTRTAVWLICDLLRQNGGEVSRTAKIHGWTEDKVRAAVEYAEAHPEEIRSLIQRAHNATAESLG